MIPNFEASGNLPPGKHLATFEEVKDRFGGNARRIWLLEGLARLLEELKKGDCLQVWLDGSFVTSKETPGDYDLCWDIYGVDLAKIDDRLFLGSKRSERKEIYRGDIFANQIEGGSGKPFEEFFQLDRDGNPKGILVIRLKEQR
ncbi:MAG: hypothetical protein RRB13_11220 [bacterium]|nr:hypothetical protein [bacterium]